MLTVRLNWINSLLNAHATFEETVQRFTIFFIRLSAVVLGTNFPLTQMKHGGVMLGAIIGDIVGSIYEWSA